MLTEERQRRILETVEERGSVTAQELMMLLDASESTIRRDLTSMAKDGLLNKVHGGAMAKKPSSYETRDDLVELRKSRNTSEKMAIAKYAAGLITSSDFVYLDAGTTTQMMIDFLDAPGAIFVTNAVEHARLLTAKGYTAYILGGEFKSVTEAIVGEEAVATVMKYNFTKGFFGANGITKGAGFTTPELKEAMIKRKAMESTKQAYVLADNSKFGQVSAITFADLHQACIVTDQLPDDIYEQYTEIVEVEQ